MCGNVTLLGRRLRGEKSAFPKRAQTLLRDMLRVSQMRGAQSGGGAVQVRRGRRPGQVLKKCINLKRGDLAERLSGDLKRAAGHWPAHAHNFVVQTHVRYATAGHSSAHKCSSTAWPEASRSFAYALTIGRGRRTRCSRPPPVSAAALYQLLAQSRERLRVSQHLGLSTAGAYSEPRPHVPRVRTLIWGTEERRPPSAVA